MIRGVIISFNELTGAGVIKDLNAQKIGFCILPPRVSLAIGDLVSYKIIMIDSGLIATDLVHINKESDQSINIEIEEITKGDSALL